MSKEQFFQTVTSTRHQESTFETIYGGTPAKTVQFGNNAKDIATYNGENFEEQFWADARAKAEAKRDKQFLALPVSKLAEALANNSATILHQGQAILLCSGTGNGTAVPLTEKQAAGLENEAGKIRQVAQEIGFF